MLLSLGLGRAVTGSLAGHTYNVNGFVFGEGSLVERVGTGVGRVYSTVVRVTPFLRGLIIRGTLVSIFIVRITGGFLITTYLVVLYLVTVIDL